ncbi:MAG: hypothetical protein ACRCUH_03810, partial [Shewanella sp.]
YMRCLWLTGCHRLVALPRSKNRGGWGVLSGCLPAFFVIRFICYPLYLLMTSPFWLVSGSSVSPIGVGCLHGYHQGD